MKVLDTNDLHNSIQQLTTTLKLLKEQIHQIQLDVKEIVSLDNALKGQGGQAIRLFYQECHLPFLVFLQEWINEYESTLNKMSQSLQALEPSPSGVIRQSFLENELVQGLRRAEMNTSDLTSEANSIIQSVQDIVPLPFLEDEMFVRDTRHAQDIRVETIEKLQAFDQWETSSLEPLQQDLQIMNQYIEQMRSTFKNGEITLAQYKPEVLTWQNSYDKLSNKNTNIHTEQNTLQDIAEGVIEGATNAVADVWEGLKSTVKLGQNILTLTNPMLFGSEILFNRGENLLEHYRFINRIIQDPKASIQPVIDIPKYIWTGIKEAWERDVVNGDVKSRSAFFSYGLTSLGIGLLGDKGISKAGTIVKTVDKAAKRIEKIPTPINTPAPALAGGLTQHPVPYNVINNPLTQIKMSTEKVYGANTSNFSFSNIKSLYRGDNLLYSPKRPNGIGKPYISSSGNLVPASKEGLYKGRQVTVTEHILGGYRRGAKSNSPYTSFTNNNNVIGNYGENAIELNISVLRKDIQSGKVKDVVILSPKQIQKLIERDVTSSDFWKKRALNWTKRDNEYLIKGEVPSQYIKVLPKE